MLVLLLIPLLVSGFFVCHKHPAYFYKLHRQQGQYLYLHAARLGLRCFVYSSVLNVALYLLLQGPCLIWLNHIELISKVLEFIFHTPLVAARNYAWLLSISWVAVFAMPNAWSLASRLLIGRKIGLWDKEKQRTYLMGELFEDSPLDKFLFNSLMEKNLVMLTMDDRKVYVGMVFSMGEPSETTGADQEITIQPMLSGYRCKDHLKVTFTTPYKDVNQGLQTTLRQERIVSASFFDLEVYEKFQNHSKSFEVPPKCCEDTASV